WPDDATAQEHPSTRPRQADRSRTRSQPGTARESRNRVRRRIFRLATATPRGRRPTAVLIPSRRARAAGLPGGQRAAAGPIQVSAAVGEQCQEAIPQEAGDRQWRLQRLGGGEHESDVLLPEFGGEAGGFELVACDEAAVRLVHGRTEQR